MTLHRLQTKMNQPSYTETTENISDGLYFNKKWHDTRKANLTIAGDKTSIESIQRLHSSSPSSMKRGKTKKVNKWILHRHSPRSQNLMSHTSTLPVDDLISSTNSPSPVSTSLQYNEWEMQPEIKSLTCTIQQSACWVNWKRKLLYTGWRGPLDILVSLTILTMSLQYYIVFLQSNENRTDINEFATLSDPILPHLPTIDLSIPLFIMAWGSILLSIYLFYEHPELVMECVQLHIALVWARISTLYLTPLETPPNSIPLVDPLSNQNGIICMRDLFFSGHTATTCITFFIIPTVNRRGKAWKTFCFMIVCATGIMVLVQKTHYTIDVVAAPCFAYSCHGIVKNARAFATSLRWNPMSSNFAVINPSKSAVKKL